LAGTRVVGGVEERALGLRVFVEDVLIKWIHVNYENKSEHGKRTYGSLVDINNWNFLLGRSNNLKLVSHTHQNKTSTCLTFEVLGTFLTTVDAAFSITIF
jgi:hypothetical protein